MTGSVLEMKTSVLPTATGTQWSRCLSMADARQMKVCFSFSGWKPGVAERADRIGWGIG